MSKQIVLTVKRVNGTAPSAPYSTIVDTENLLGLEAVGSDSRFFAPHWQSQQGPIEVVVDETFAQIQTLIGLTSSSGVWGLIDMAVAGNRTIAAHDVIDPISGNALKLPKGAIIKTGMALVKTTFTSATDAGTIALGLETDGAAVLKAAIAISNGANPWDIPAAITGAKTALIPVNTAATFVGPLTADQKVQFTVAVEALLLGKMLIYLELANDPLA